RGKGRGKELTENLRRTLNKNLSPWGAEVVSVILHSVELPMEIEASLSDKAMALSVAKEQRSLQEYNIQKVQFLEEVKDFDLKLRNELEWEKSQANMSVEMLKAELLARRAQASASCARIAASVEVDLLKIEAESALAISRSELRAETESALLSRVADKE
ncbi:unnamed protein product, partial [Discosporangium mesarthrocarpum]